MKWVGCISWGSLKEQNLHESASVCTMLIAGDQETIPGSWFFLTTLWDPGIALELSELCKCLSQCYLTSPGLDVGRYIQGHLAL